jgi:hypothetical protein
MRRIAGLVGVRHRDGRHRSTSGHWGLAFLLVEWGDPGGPHTLSGQPNWVADRRHRGPANTGRGSRPVVGKHQG